MNKFGTILKQLRLEAHISQMELADKLEISRSAVSMYERGEREPDFKTLEKFADFFEVDMNQLFGKNSKSSKTARAASSGGNVSMETSYADLQKLLARNGKGLTAEQKQELIRILLS